MLRYRRLVAMALHVIALLLAGPALAAPNHIAAELIAESPAGPGQTVELAIHMRPEPGWHGYWLNPGDAGLGMTLDWTLPPGAKAGPPRYPVPETLLVSGLMNHVYEHEFAVLVPFTVPAGAAPGAVLSVTVKANWLACTEKICVPEDDELRTAVTVGPARSDPRFDQWRVALPAPLGSEARFAIAGNRLRIAIPLPASVELDRPHLFVNDDHVIDYAAPQIFSRKADFLIVETARARFNPMNPVSVPAVLRLNAAGDGIAIVAATGAVPTGGEPIASGIAPALPGLPWLLLAALTGGLLLNIMPCVFPILSLKALSLARAGESGRQARGEGIAYAAGVILACLALGGLLLALRAAGQEVGWAFQLQEPLVVAALLLLTVAITANLAGLYEFAVPGFAQTGSPQGAFATGLLAAFVATPCTGPFMATAMGAALLLPATSALLLFTALGLGLALPFLAIALIPEVRRLLPRPGPWMARFRSWMALPMGLTALALLWLAWRLGGAMFASTCLAAASGLVVVLTLAGRNQRQGRSAAMTALAGLAAVAAYASFALPNAVRAPSATPEDAIGAQPFSAAALAEARTAGRPVFVYMTADWCLTCKVNEASTIERAETAEIFAREKVVALRGDWTRRDPAITRYLTTHGVAGVPLYLWYDPGENPPRQLPQVLSGPGMFSELTGSGGD